MGNEPTKGPYSYEVPNTRSAGQTGHYRHVLCKNQFKGELVTKMWDGVTTVHEAFMHVHQPISSPPLFFFLKSISVL